MQHIQETYSVADRRIFSHLDELSAGCDADFDVPYDDLEHEFAELRLQHWNQ